MPAAPVHHWTPRAEGMVGDWRDAAIERAAVCEAEAVRLHMQQRVLSIPQLVMSAIVGSLGFAGVSSSVYGVLGVLMAVMAALDSALRLGIRGHDKQTQAAQLRKVATQIDVQLVRDRPHREEAQGFIDKIVVQLEPLRTHCPSSNPNTTSTPVPVVNCMMVDNFFTFSPFETVL